MPILNSLPLIIYTPIQLRLDINVFVLFAFSYLRMNKYISVNKAYLFQLNLHATVKQMTYTHVYAFINVIY